MQVRSWLSLGFLPVSCRQNNFLGFLMTSFIGCFLRVSFLVNLYDALFGEFAEVLSVKTALVNNTISNTVTVTSADNLPASISEGYKWIRHDYRRSPRHGL